MLFFNLIISNDILNLVLVLALFLVIFYGSGRILQNYFSFKKSNQFLAIPIGFFSYFLITELTYLPTIFFEMENFIRSFFEVIKNFFLIVLIIIYNKSWLKIQKPNWYLIRTFSLVSLSVSIPILIYFLFDFYISSFTPLITSDSGFTLIDSIRDISNKNYFESSFTSSSISLTMEKYQGFYYWIFNISALTSENDILDMIMRYFVPIVIIFVITFSIIGTLIDPERNIFTFVYLTIISTFTIIGLGFIGQYNLFYYILPIIIFITLLLYSYSTEKAPNDNLITASIFLLLSIQVFSIYAIIIFLIYGFCITMICLLKDGFFIRSLIFYFSLFLLMSIGLSIIVLVDKFSELFSFSISYLLVILFLFIIIIVPLYSLAYSPNRQQELISFEKKTRDRILIWFPIGVLIFTVLIMGLASFSSISINDAILEYFDLINSNILSSIFIYLIFIFVPSILFLGLKRFTNKFDFLMLFPFINLMFNPITLPIIIQLIGSEMSVFFIFIPSLVLIFVWIIDIILKLTYKFFER